MATHIFFLWNGEKFIDTIAHLHGIESGVFCDISYIFLPNSLSALWRIIFDKKIVTSHGVHHKEIVMYETFHKLRASI